MISSSEHEPGTLSGSAGTPAMLSVTWEHRHMLQQTMSFYLHRRVILRARSWDEGLRPLLGGCASWWKHTQPKAGEASKPLRWVNPFSFSLSLPCRGCPLSVTCWYRPSPFGSISCPIFTDSCDVYFATWFCTCYFSCLIYKTYCLADTKRKHLIKREQIVLSKLHFI